MRINDLIPDLFRRRDVIINASQLYLNKVLNSIIPFFLIPYYNKVFGVEQYGELIFIQAIISLLIYVTDYGFIVTGTREVSIHAQNKNHLSSLVSSVLILKLILTSIVFFVLVFSIWVRSLPPQVMLLYTVSFMALTLQNFMPSWFFQGMKKNSIITLSNLASKIILISLVVIFVNEGSPLWIVPLIDALAYFLFFAVGLYLIFTSFDLRFVLPTFEQVKSNFKLSQDNFLITILSWVTTGGILILTEKYVSDQSFGYFGIFTRICYYIFASAHQINLTVFPYLSERFARSEDEGNKMLNSISRIYFLFVCVLLFGGIIFGALFFNTVFDDEFNQNLGPHLNTFYLLVIWVSLVLLNNFIGLQYFVSRKQDYIYRRYYFVNVVISVTGCVILAPKFGIAGSASSVVLGEFALLCLLLHRYSISKNSLKKI